MLEPRFLSVDVALHRSRAQARAGTLATLRALADGGVTVLMIEQNVKSGLAVSDHALALEGGRVALEAPAAEILSHPRIRSVFLGGHVADS